MKATSAFLILLLHAGSSAAQAPQRFRLEQQFTSASYNPYLAERLANARNNLAAAGGDPVNAAPAPSQRGQTAVYVLSVTNRDSAGGKACRVVIESFTLGDRVRDSTMAAALGQQAGRSFEFFALKGTALFPGKDSLKIPGDDRTAAEALASFFNPRPVAGANSPIADTTVVTTTDWHLGAPRIATSRTVTVHSNPSVGVYEHSSTSQRFTDPGLQGGSELTTITKQTRQTFGADPLAISDVETSTTVTARIFAGSGPTYSRQTGVRTLTPIKP